VLKPIVLPRQARDKDWKPAEKQGRFSQGQRRGVVLTVSGDDDNPGGGSGGGAGAVSLGRQTVEAEVPLKELVAYSTALRSLTQGGGDFTMALARYDFAIE
jgi:translation elongation factor EF-G